MTETKLTDAAFGIVPILRKEDGDRVLLIQHHAGHWSFPKGHADPGETALETACREFVEETGIQDFQVLDDRSYSEEYIFTQKGQTITKTVIYFTAFVHSETVECQAEEIQAYAWLTFEAALAKLTFPSAKQVLTEVYQTLHLPKT
jgi:bis(5'-nucleosidyl)-tetraphosphatase